MPAARRGPAEVIQKSDKRVKSVPRVLAARMGTVVMKLCGSPLAAKVVKKCDNSVEKVQHGHLTYNGELRTSAKSMTKVLKNCPADAGPREWSCKSDPKVNLK